MNDLMRLPGKGPAKFDKRHLALLVLAREGSVPESATARDLLAQGLLFREPPPYLESLVWDKLRPVHAALIDPDGWYLQVVSKLAEVWHEVKELRKPRYVLTEEGRKLADMAVAAKKLEPLT